jgi:hypothetical protein
MVGGRGVPASDAHVDQVELILGPLEPPNSDRPHPPVVIGVAAVRYLMPLAQRSWVKERATDEREKQSRHTVHRAETNRDAPIEYSGGPICSCCTGSGGRSAQASANVRPGADARPHMRRYRATFVAKFRFGIAPTCSSRKCRLARNSDRSTDIFEQ